MRLTRIMAIGLASLLLLGCASASKMNAVQLGMTKDQVRAALGTPLLVDIFHADRWDYVYMLDRRGQPRQQRHLSVFFEEGRLARLGGDVVAAPADGKEVQ